tara:strand:+ start:444 stop:1142 length:699 start_codon:yes stop_codon:yes gene_type:complete
MDTFEIVVLSIAIILLILVLGTFVYFMTKVDKTSKWPPVVSECPDFWTLKMGNVEDGSLNICVDTNNTIDKKCKSFHADSEGSGFDSNWNQINFGEFKLDQKENDNTIHNDYLVYIDENNNYQYSGYDKDIHSINAQWSSKYNVNASGINDLVTDQTLLNDGNGSDISWKSNISSTYQFNSTNNGIYTISDKTPVEISFQLPDADLDGSELKEEKKKWARKCNVSWDGITNT